MTPGNNDLQWVQMDVDPQSREAETEHFEIAVYETLITHAEATNKPEIVTLLRENLEQEQHTLQEVRDHSKRLAQETAAAA